MNNNSLRDIILGALILATVIILLNPDLVEVLSDKAASSSMSLLRVIDKLAVDYQLMRGNWNEVFDGKEQSGSTEGA